MRVPTVEELALLPEDRALQRWFDGRNWLTLRLLLAVLAPAAALLVPLMLSQGHPVRAAAAGASLALTAACWAVRRRAFFERAFRPLALGFVIAQFALYAGMAQHEVVIALGVFLFPVWLLGLRLRVSEALLLATVFAATAAGVALWHQPEAVTVTTRIALVLGIALAPAALLAASLGITRRHRRAFLARWREQASRERERVRMRDELADARRIQLSMLPDAAPDHPRLDVAAASLPASEVGGDFYDYLPLPDGRLAVVVGDVAGHGMAAGLVLATVKGGLHLLRDELHRPVEVLARLDRMLRETVRWRMFVTLQVALLDPAGGRLTVANAGHPQALLLSGGAVRAVGAPAPPLGTRLPAAFREEVVPLAPGDVVLLHTDGVIELAGPGGEPLGDGRLTRALVRSVQAARAASAGRRGGDGRRAGDGRCPAARDVREGLIEELSRFKRDAPQHDDLTLLVICTAPA